MRLERYARSVNVKEKPMSDQTTVVTAFGGADPRCETLFQALRLLVYERGAGIPIPSVIGVLRLLEHKIIQEEENA
jgi:hypothetical protein